MHEKTPGGSAAGKAAEFLRCADQHKSESDTFRPLTPLMLSSLRAKLAPDRMYNSNVIEGNRLRLGGASSQGSRITRSGYSPERFVKDK